MFYIINSESMKKDSKLRRAKLLAANKAAKGPVKVVEEANLPKIAKRMPFIYHYNHTHRVGAIYSTGEMVKRDKRICKEAYHNVCESRKVNKQNCKITKTRDEATFKGFIIFEI